MKRTATVLAALLSSTLAGATGPSATSTPAPPRAADGASAEGKQLFMNGTTPSCATCHALRDAGATGNIGPDLDALKPDAERVRKAVQQGFENMPAFGHVLSAAQTDAVARYVAQATGATK